MSGNQKSIYEAEILRRWFYGARRELPWRENSSPYAVWISEVMLQQTQVAVVIPYFHRWMERFPTIYDLATAHLDEVIKMWEGLGYYSRARNLHEGAKYIVTMFGGHLPEEEEELKKIKGIGDYTVGAIRSFAFKEKAAAVDGNVLRVISRFHAIEDPIDTPKTKQIIKQLTLNFLPDDEPWIVMEALIELGALICQKKASCESCPLKTSCLSFKLGKTHVLPRKERKVDTTILHRFVALIHNEEGILAKKGEQGKVMADLWEFPYFEMISPLSEAASWQSKLEDFFSISLKYEKSLPIIHHGFTRFKAVLYPSIWKTYAKDLVHGYEWISFSEIKKNPFSSGHRKLIKSFDL